MTVATDTSAHTVNGTVFADLRGRVVSIGQFLVDMVAEGTFMFPEPGHPRGHLQVQERHHPRAQ